MFRDSVLGLISVRSKLVVLLCAGAVGFVGCTQVPVSSQGLSPNIQVRQQQILQNFSRANSMHPERHGYLDQRAAQLVRSTNVLLKTMGITKTHVPENVNRWDYILGFGQRSGNSSQSDLFSYDESIVYEVAPTRIPIAGDDQRIEWYPAFGFDVENNMKSPAHDMNIAHPAFAIVPDAPSGDYFFQRHSELSESNDWQWLPVSVEKPIEAIDRLVDAVREARLYDDKGIARSEHHQKVPFVEVVKEPIMHELRGAYFGRESS